MINDFSAATLEHLDAVYGAAMRLTRNPADAADLVQETFLRAVRFQDRFEAGTNLRAWLLTIMTHMFINGRRRSVCERKLEDADRAEAVTEAFVSSEALRMARSPERQFLSRVSANEVRDVLDRLPDEFRTVLLLADVEQFTYREIAEMVGCPIGTVMSRLFRARRLVQRALLETERSSESAEASEEEDLRDLDARTAVGAEGAGSPPISPPISLDEARRRRGGKR